MVDDRRGRCFVRLEAADLLNRVRVPGMPFQWTVNPYRGCEVGCRYCYARPTHEYLGHPDPRAFEERIYVKAAAPGRLRARLRRARDAGQEVAIGTATDPYQPAEERFGIMRGVLEEALSVPGLRISLTTKSALVVRDLDRLVRLDRVADLTVHLSLIALDAGLLRRLEPRASRPDLRLRALSALARAGIATRLFVMPIMPCLTDGETGLRALLEAGRRAGANGVAWNVLFLRGSTRTFFLDFLASEFPPLVAEYRRLYGERPYVGPAYRQQIDARMSRLAAVTGLAATPPVPRPGPRQLGLVW